MRGQWRRVRGRHSRRLLLLLLCRRHQLLQCSEVSGRTAARLLQPLQLLKQINTGLLWVRGGWAGSVRHRGGVTSGTASSGMASSGMASSWVARRQ